MNIQSVLERIHPGGKLFILIGLFLLFLGVAAVFQAIIVASAVEIKTIDDMAKLSDYSNLAVVRAMKIAQGVSAALAFIVPTLLFAWFASEKKIAYLKLNRGFSFYAGILTILLVFAALPAINLSGELNSKMSLPDFMSGIEQWMKSSEEKLKQLTEAFLNMEDAGDLFLNLFVIALLAAVGEELLFRGGMQNIFMEWTKNIHAAVWITAILFSALHAQFYGFLPRMLLGVIMGYLYAWSGSLWLPMLFHFVNNGMAVVAAYFIGKGVISENIETFGTDAGAAYLIPLSIVVSFGLLYLLRIKKIDIQ